MARGSMARRMGNSMVVMFLLGWLVKDLFKGRKEVETHLVYNNRS